ILAGVPRRGGAPHLWTLPPREVQGRPEGVAPYLWGGRVSRRDFRGRVPLRDHRSRCGRRGRAPLSPTRGGGGAGARGTGRSLDSPADVARVAGNGRDYDDGEWRGARGGPAGKSDPLRRRAGGTPRDAELRRNDAPGPLVGAPVRQHSGPVPGAVRRRGDDGHL